MAANIQDVVMLFGDSITQGAWEPDRNGFGQRLSHVYARKLDVLNRGLSGYNTDWALPVLEQCLVTKKDQPHVPGIRLLTIWFGANDACIQPSPQHVPLVRFTSNLEKLVDLVHSPESVYYSPSTRIVLMSPPPVNTYQRAADLGSRELPLDLDRNFETTKAYAKAVKEVAHAKQVAFVDIWTEFWQAAGEKEVELSRYLIDGLHPNENGYRVTYDALMKTIAETYPDVHPDNLPFVFRPWFQIVEEQQKASL
ncbi:GDSL Lipase/Acylhydrolase [Tricholoma matsutake]|nr:GDSL Lipase/Acylhydrolase [Tricholoma matsutake 945]